MSKHVMIDLETLDTVPHAAILSIGAVRFDKDNTYDKFYRSITLDSNIKLGRSISGSTVAWWMGQSKEAQSVFSDPEAVSLWTALADLYEWFGEEEGTAVWGNGSVFDIAILNDAYGESSPPWKFWDIKCFRTIKTLEAAKKSVKPNNPLAHNALSDAEAQAEHLQNIWKEGVGA